MSFKRYRPVLFISWRSEKKISWYEERKYNFSILFYFHYFFIISSTSLSPFFFSCHLALLVFVVAVFVCLCFCCCCYCFCSKSCMFPSGPLAAPRHVKANMTDYSSARVKWSPNPSPFVLEYVIQFSPLDASISVITVRVNSTETMVEIDGLTSSTNYSVQLHTVTLCKNGSWSKAVYVASEEGGKDILINSFSFGEQSMWFPFSKE